MFELKRLSVSAIPSALAKAERYRLLNEPEQARSICEDILAAEPGNKAARTILILTLTDLFPLHEAGVVNRARQLAAELESDYERHYYAGLIFERRARALLHRTGHGRVQTAGELLRDAMEAYESADAVKPPDNDDALLRWNACARLFMAHPELTPPAVERPEPLMLE